MDDVEQLMLQFELALDNFNDVVRNSIAQIQSSHETVDLLWQDSMRVSYDERWVPLRDQLEHYNGKIGPEYVETLLTRLKFLREYLHGD